MSSVQCVARSKASGLQCRRQAIAGGTVCVVHGGRAPQVKAAAARRLALGEAQGELERLGVPIETTPPEAMLAMVREAAGNVAFLRRRVQDLDQLLAGPDGEDLLAALGGGGKEGRDIKARAPQAITGRVDPKNWRAERHVLVAMYDDERERLMRWSKWCREAGVEEARVAIEQETGQELGRVLRGTVDELLRMVVELFTVLCAELGVDPAVALERVRAVWAARVPGIVRAQIETVTSREVGA